MNVGWQFASGQSVFAPDQLPNLGLWLDAQQFTPQADGTAIVTNWLDQSGHGRDAVPTNNPVYRTGHLAGQINGNPSIQGNAANAYFEIPYDYSANTAGVTIFVVARMSSNAATGKGMISWQDVLIGNQWYTLEQYSGWLTGFDVGSGFLDTETFVSTDPNQETFVWNGPGATAKLYNAGVQTGLTRTVSSTPPTANQHFALNLFLFHNDNGYSNHQIGEILIYERPLTDGERGKVEAYLAAKWGF